MRLHFIAGVVAVGMLFSPAAVVAAEQHAPLGFQLMCLQHPDQCKAKGPAQIALTPSFMAQAKQVNADVNRAITPRADAGGIDVWTVNTKAGDCEDYVLAKRRILMSQGISPSALRIAYVKTRKNEGHAILVVHTDKADLVLDNLNPRVRPLSQSGYRIISISGSNPEVWTGV